MAEYNLTLCDMPSCKSLLDRYQTGSYQLRLEAKESTALEGVWCTGTLRETSACERSVSLEVKTDVGFVRKNVAEVEQCNTHKQSPPLKAILLLR